MKRFAATTFLLIAVLLLASRAAAERTSYDLVVVGGTPGGIACAVRAAREGVDVLLVNRHNHLGGMLTAGLGVWDSQWEGHRAPLYDEVRQTLFDHYRAAYGPDSPQYRDCRPGKSGYTNGRFEPHVAEKILDALVNRQRRLTVLRGFVPAEAEREGAVLRSVTFRQFKGPKILAVRAQVWADATYEGDLAALAKVPYRVGRESREEFNEPNAGILYMRAMSQPPDDAAARLAALHDALALRKFAGFQAIMPQSTGAADPAVQACNYRTMLTTDPANRVAVEKPANYDPYYLKSLEIFSGVESVPNDKFSWNRPQLIGRQTAYVEADWPTRQRIMDEHWETTQALLWFLQHDSTIPSRVREAWQEYGLAKDEFADNGHRPYEMYVRETRRIAGRRPFTQHDAMLAPGLLRAPVQADSIAMTEWYLDTHTCTMGRVPGALDEGKMMLHHETFPGQVPYASLLPQGVDNLLVPVCLGATHVAWGTIRLEPVWMQTGESAGLAAALALKAHTTPAALDADSLVRRLAETGMMVSFFNDVDVARTDPWIAAAQYFGTKGFFHDYNARPRDPLKQSTARVWLDGLARLQRGALDANQLARAVARAETSASPPATRADLAPILPARTSSPAPITRAEALELLFQAAKPAARKLK